MNGEVIHAQLERECELRELEIVYTRLLYQMLW
jgi:hypothetical protein